MDKGLERELTELGLHPGKSPFMLPQDESRDMGVTCRECGSKKVVYTISQTRHPLFKPGGYCYRHLLAHCKQGGCLPYPIESNLLRLLKQDLGIPLYEEPINKLEI